MRGRAETMATFCLATGMTPTEYRALTLAEFEAFTTLINRRNCRG